MLSSQLTPVQERLYHEREQVLEEIENLLAVIQSEVDLAPDEGDALITEHQTASILLGILEQKLHDINAALALIKTGHYSQCERCGMQIEPGRLLAKPDARYCITCQEIVERLAHQAYAEALVAA